VSGYFLQEAITARRRTGKINLRIGCYLDFRENVAINLYNSKIQVRKDGVQFYSKRKDNYIFLSAASIITGLILSGFNLPFIIDEGCAQAFGLRCVTHLYDLVFNQQVID